MENKAISKICSTCKEGLPLSCYYSQEKYTEKRGYYTFYLSHCKECAKEATKKWRKLNPEKPAIYQKKQDMKTSNKERRRAYSKDWIENGKLRDWQRDNKDKLKMYAEKRKEAKTHTFSKKEWIKCKEYFNNSCAYCGVTEKDHRDRINQDLHKEHVDNYGSNDISNCVPACKTCNSEKNTIDFETWYTEENRKFNKERKEKILKWIKEDYIK